MDSSALRPSRLLHRLVPQPALPSLQQPRVALQLKQATAATQAEKRELGVTGRPDALFSSEKQGFSEVPGAISGVNENRFAEIHQELLQVIALWPSARRNLRKILVAMIMQQRLGAGKPLSRDTHDLAAMMESAAALADEAERLIAAGFHRISAVSSRSCLQLMLAVACREHDCWPVRQTGKKAGKPFGRGLDTQVFLGRLRWKGAIDRAQLVIFDRCNRIGNKAAHGADVEPHDAMTALGIAQMARMILRPKGSG